MKIAAIPAGASRGRVLHSLDVSESGQIITNTSGFGATDPNFMTELSATFSESVSCGPARIAMKIAEL